MKNKIKRFISLLLSVILLTGFMHGEVLAAEGNDDVVLELEAEAFVLDQKSDIMPRTIFIDASISVAHSNEGM